MYICPPALVVVEPKQRLPLGRDHDAEERASLEGHKAISFGKPIVMVQYDAHVCAPVSKEGLKQHLVIHVAAQLFNKDLELQ